MFLFCIDDDVLWFTPRLAVVLRILLDFLGLADGLAGAPKMPLWILSSTGRNGSLLFSFDREFDLNIAIPKIRN